MAAYEAAFAAHTASIGKTPQCMNAFCSDNGAGPGTASSSPPVQQMQWTAWSWSLSPTAKLCVPVVGIPMLFAGMTSASYASIAAGSYDYIWSGIAQAWASNGFITMYARIGWEFNGSWYLWSVTNLTPALLTEWIAAWNHIAQVMKSTSRITVKTIWNPACTSWNQFSLAQCYPGSTYVDVIGPDLYSVCYPNTSLSGFSDPNFVNTTTAAYYDWKGYVPSTTPTNTWTSVLDTLPAWMAQAYNREHYWDWPGSTGWQQQDNNNAIGMQDMLAFCKTEGKNIAIPECGTGLNPNYPNCGINNDGDFPLYLLSRLTGAASATPSLNPPVAVELVNVWDIDVSDGSWLFALTPQSLTVAGTVTFNANGTMGVSFPAVSTTLQPTPQPAALASWKTLAGVL